MSEDENVLARWSRLKREGARKTAVDATEDNPAARQAPEAAEQSNSDNTLATVELPNLPPIESIVAGSDIRAFLQAGVPAALTRAALRRAWSSDPAIRDFIEMAENQWDFANPDMIPGFGSLTAADDVPRLVAKALGDWINNPEPIAEGYETPSALPHASGSGDPKAVDDNQLSSRAERDSDSECAAEKSADNARAPQQTADSAPPAGVRRRSHGGALPS